MTTYTIIIQHEDYEQIKNKFTKLRGKWGLRWINHFDTNYFLFHQWKGNNDDLEVFYIINQDIPRIDDKPNINEAYIIYTFSEKSEFVYDFIKLLNENTYYHLREGRFDYDIPKTATNLPEPKPYIESIEIPYMVGGDLYHHYRTKQLLSYLPDNLNIVWS